VTDEKTIIAALLDSYRFILPEIVLGAFACVIFLGGAFRSSRYLWTTLSLLGLVAALLTLGLTADARPASTAGPSPAVFAAPITADALARLIKLVALVGGVVLVLFSWDELPERQAADYQACLLIMIAGVCLTAAANDLVVLFLALELISIPTYIMLYLPKHDTGAQEAAVKYFLLSVFSSGLLLFGFSYLYGLAGTTNLPALFDTLHRTEKPDLPAVAQIAVVLVVAALGFKITAVPFHFYAPDVYQGTATVNAAVLAFAPKVAGFVALLRLLGFVLPAEVLANVHPGGTANAPELGQALSAQVPILLWFLAAVTMFLGNLLALLQDNLKRLMAYSSVAHAGYMLIALAVAPYLRTGRPEDVDGIEALLFYLVAYGAMTIGVFAVIAYLDSPQRPVETVDDLGGLSRSHPGLSLLMVLFLFSLIGIPLTAGFTAKFMVFFGAMAVQGGLHATLFRTLAVVGVINAAIGAWYYLRMVTVMYLRNPVKPPEPRRGWPALVAIWLCALLTLGLSLGPAAQWLTQATRQATGVRASAE
jgi:NADH-quinone oxidoreductase subunit N